MASVPKPWITPQEYLERERKAEHKSEYFRGEMFAMAGATWEHTLIKDNMATETRNQLRDGPCQALTSDLRVLVDATGLYTYPDIIVVCDEPQFLDGEFDTLLNPRCLIEVLSESSEAYDRGDKFKHYRKIPTLQEYILISQKEPLVERHVRQADGSWLMKEFTSLTQIFEYASIPSIVPLGEIYRGITFSQDAGR